MLNLKEIRVFLAAAETENFSEAARRLSMTQPAVSQQVRSLEKHLDIELFERFGRHVALTDAGRALIPLARELFDRANRIEAAMGSLHGDVVGLLTIGCSTAAGKYVLTRVLAGFRERHPRVDVVCHVTNRPSALDLLRTGEAQIGVASLREPGNGIEYRPFLDDRIILITPPQHPWAMRGTPISVPDLRRERFLLREEGSGTLEAVRDALAVHDLTLDHLEVHMVLGSSEAIRMAVAQGVGAGFVSALVAAEAVALGSVAIVEIEDFDLSRTLYLMRSTSRPPTQPQAHFWEYALGPETDAVRSLAGTVLDEAPWA
jgi:DNA-binding transcriptional LysR family regulator